MNIGKEGIFAYNKRINETIYTGHILHIDGDKNYMLKSAYYYKELGLNAVLRNIAEQRQPIYIRRLLNKVRPDILIITGHDAMIKKGTDFYNLNNYKNSKFFVNSVKEARKWEPNKNKLVIFAGACQSFFEAIMLAGANFASSPGRILIDYIDPLIVAEKIALTDSDKMVKIADIVKELRNGEASIGGTQALGKKKRNF